jgi:hypothetical protein
MQPYQGTVVESIASQNIGLEVAIGPRRLTANAIAERQRLSSIDKSSMSARGRLPTSNTFELIRKWKLVKEEEEKQQQKVKVRWRSRHCSPDCHERDWKTHIPALAHRCGHIKSQTNWCSTWKSRHKLVVSAGSD